ncbi:MAG: hypothetical protein ACP5T5_04865, partial [Thermoprotei archaeon]
LRFNLQPQRGPEHNPCLNERCGSDLASRERRRRVALLNSEARKGRGSLHDPRADDYTMVWYRIPRMAFEIMPPSAKRHIGKYHALGHKRRKEKTHYGTR